MGLFDFLASPQAAPIPRPGQNQQQQQEQYIERIGEGGLKSGSPIPLEPTRKEMEEGLKQRSSSTGEQYIERIGEGGLKSGGPSSLQPVQDPNSIRGGIRSLGIDELHWKESLAKTMDALGLGPDEWDDPVNTRLYMKRVLSVLDPEGKVTAQILADTAAGEAPVQEQSAAGPQGQVIQDPRMMEMEGKRQRIRQLYSEMGRAPWSGSAIGITIFVLLSAITGPRNALLLMGAGRDPRMVHAEIDELKEELRMDWKMAERERDEQKEIRREAARMMERRQLEGERVKRERANIYLRHTLGLSGKTSRAPDAEKAIYQKLSADYRRAYEEAADAEKRYRDPMNFAEKKANYEEWQKKKRKYEAIGEMIEVPLEDLKK